MGMDYIRVEAEGSSVSIHFLAEFWVFLVLTTILLILTMGSYLFWLRAENAKHAQMVHKRTDAA